jgi:hypothetical protein
MDRYNDGYTDPLQGDGYKDRNKTLHYKHAVTKYSVTRSGQFNLHFPQTVDVAAHDARLVHIVRTDI